MSLSEFFTGVPDDSEYNAAPQVAAINPSTYNIQGLQQYLQQSQGNASALGNIAQPNFAQQNAGTMSSQDQLLQYLQGVGNGTQSTAADALLQTASAQNAANNQSSALQSQGVTGGALALRNLSNANQQNQGNIAGQAAQQRLQEQFQGVNAASTQANNIINQRVAQSQMMFNNAQQNLTAQQSIQNDIFGANSAQTSYTVQGAQNNQAYQEYMRGQYLNRINQQAQGENSLFKTGVGALATVAGSALGGPLGGALAGALTSGLTGALSGGSSSNRASAPTSLASFSAGNNFNLGSAPTSL